MDRIERAAAEVFGYEELRPGQHEAVEAVVDGRDVLGGLERAGADRLGSNGDGEVEFVFELPADGIGERLSAVLRAAGEAPREFLSAGARRLIVWRRGE